MAASLRRIDLAAASCVADLRSVCAGRGAGFFFLKMSAAESAAAARALGAARSFFALPQQKKDALALSPTSYYRYRGLAVPGSGPGYRGPAADVNFQLDTRESFNVGPCACVYLLSASPLAARRRRDAHTVTPRGSSRLCSPDSSQSAAPNRPPIRLVRTTQSSSRPRHLGGRGAAPRAEPLARSPGCAGDARGVRRLLAAALSAKPRALPRAVARPGDARRTL